VVENGRAKYISDVREIFASGKPGAVSWLDKLLMVGWLGRDRHKTGMRRTLKLSYSLLLVAFVIGVVLFSSAGATALAAQSALPGDALYPIKMTIEQAQVRLAEDAARLAELHLEFAEHRLDEISGLIAEGRYGEIERATQEFEYHVQQALVAMQTVAAGDPLRAQALAARVTSALSEYARALSTMRLNVPESTRASMDRAIITSQNMGENYPSEHNENANLNIFDDQGNSNGNDGEDGQANQNGGISDENQNGDENTNINSNENDSSDENNDNQNAGDDQNSNSNLNNQENDNDRDSRSDNGGDNQNANDNDNQRDEGNINDGSGGNGNSGDD
jgi:hypothetical protein